MLRGMNETVQALPPAVRRRPGAPTLLSLAAGVMLTTALPPMRGTSLLAPAALALLFHLLGGHPRPGWLTFVFGVGHAASLMSWLFFLDPAKSIPTRALIPVQAAAAILFVAAHYWLLGVAFGFLRRRLGPRLLLAWLPVLWVAVELVRSRGELAFPWCLVGTAWLDTPVAPLFAAAGETGLGAATAVTAAALVAIGRRIAGVPADRTGWRALLVATVLAWVLLWIGSAPRGASLPDGHRTSPLPVACVQADVAQEDKWDDAKIDSTRIPYTDLTARAAGDGAELVVWAETAVPAYVRFDRELMRWLRAVASENRVAILTGFPDGRFEPDPAAENERRLLKFNAAGLVSPEGELLETYGKHHLVPIGESMPFQRYLPWLGRIDVGQAEWTPGAPPGPMSLPTDAGEVSPAVLICFEGAFSHLARGAVRRGANVLVNITNDGWFGYTAGPRQHAALARIRAIECGVPLVRCANNGISMICDAQGRVLDRLDMNLRGIVGASIDPRPRGTLYAELGRWPVLAFLALWLVVSAALARRDRREAA
ncbi:apolipoprotein N-acyltransferase [bacterium]|nr:apolipoprotein N-acyltransferase [bacterium]